MALVAIPVKDRLELTQACVSALDLRAKDELVIIDNGSAGRTVQWARDEGIRLHEMAGASLCQMWDWAIAEAGKRHIALLNNDVAPEPEMIRHLESILRRHSDVGIAYPETQQQGEGIRCSRGLGPLGMTGWAFMLRGGIAWPRLSELYSWWFGDAELERFARHRGYRVCAVGNARAAHVDGGSQTAKSQSPLGWTDPRFSIIADRVIFESRWHDDADE